MFDFSNANLARIAHKEMLCDNLAPLSVLLHFKAKVLLESAYNETGKDRYSIIVLNEAFRIYKQEGKHWLIHNGHKTLFQESIQKEIFQNMVQSVKPEREQKRFESKDSDFLESLALVRSLAPVPENLPPHLPLPLGGAGYLGYEFFSEIESEVVQFSNPALYDAPECGFIFGRDFLIFDHLFDRIHIVSVSYAYEKHIFKPDMRVQEIAQNLSQLACKGMGLNAQDMKVEKDFSLLQATMREEYESMVRNIQARIAQGDLLQCVPSQYMQISSSLPPLQAYRTLRHQNPSPYMFYYDFDDFVILGASPEIMLRLKTIEGKSQFILRPIAGTRPRGQSVAQDLELERELLSDPKENAEHLMLVDLARNDAGKVSEGGSVHVVSRNKIERYSRVMHIVSEVQGVLDSKRFSKRDALKAVFPAGTLSGAPKIEAIKTIESLESYARGVYGGAIGYFTYDEDMDFAIAIRTAVYQNGVYFLRSGAGIVYDSLPNAEYEETLSKIRSQLDMLGISFEN